MVSILKNVLYLFTITHFPIVTVTVIYSLVDRNIFLDLEHMKSSNMILLFLIHLM